MGFRLKCREVSLRLVRAEHEPVSWWAHLPVRLHLLACTGCQRFARQMKLMSSASAAWRRYSERGEAE